jgi:hypothetical protein
LRKKTFLFFLFFFSPTCAPTKRGDNLENDNKMFEIEASFKEFTKALVTKELCFFFNLFIIPTCEDPLVWWCNYKRQVSITKNPFFLGQIFISSFHA